MAAGLERIGRELGGRVERLFKRKASTAQFSPVPGGNNQSTPALTALTALTTPVNLDSLTFPQPSFIRPTSNRMLARDESVLTSGRRARSLPETPNTTSRGSGSRSGSSMLANPSTSPRGDDADPFLPKIPKRSSSLTPTRRGNSLAGLLDFDFANASTRGSSGAAISPTPSPRSRSPELSNEPAGPLLVPLQGEPIGPQPYGLLTPPQSANQEKFAALRESPRGKEVPPLGSLNIPTPEASPGLLPLPEPALVELEENQGNPSTNSQLSPITPLTIFKENIKSVLAVAGQSSDVADPRSVLRTTTPNHESAMSQTMHDLRIMLTEATPPSGKRVLKELTFDDFCSLSDEDVVSDEEKMPPGGPSPGTSGPSSSKSTNPTPPPRCGLPPNPPVMFGAQTTSPGLITLSPPLNGRPATAGAFQAYRLAAKYRFDLVYVVNLWPSNVGCTQPTSGADVQYRMTGRLLAAYGLASLKAPFQISVPVHKTILQREDWLEYRSDENAEADEFSRGFMRSYYTGYSPDGRWRPVDRSTSSIKPKGKGKGKTSPAVNRGIVFAGYRLPRADGTHIESDAAELEALHKDAESLVEMVIDLSRHATPRKLGRAGLAPLFAASAHQGGFI